jgi:hypothetical protein
MFYRSVYEVMVGPYWRVLYNDFEEVQQILFSNYVFTLTAGKMANQRNIFQIQKVELFIFVK